MASIKLFSQIIRTVWAASHVITADMFLTFSATSLYIRQQSVAMFIICTIT